MKNFIVYSALTIVSTLCINLVHAETELSAEEVKVLFTGKTFDGYNTIKERSYKVYSDPNGTMIHKNHKRTKEFKWEVDAEGRHCAIFNNRPRCGKIVSKSDGVYFKMHDGEHINTLTNFVDGNQIN